MNNHAYVNGNPVNWIDNLGLWSPRVHNLITQHAVGFSDMHSISPNDVSAVDFLPGSQDPENSHWHAMSDGLAGQSVADAQAAYDFYLQEQISSCSRGGLARAMHATQDSFAGGHTGFQSWSGGTPSFSHIMDDMFPSSEEFEAAVNATKSLLNQYNQQCSCR